jgi:hypothetical protein
MASPAVISPEFLLWSQALLLWSIATYGIMADPLKGETIRLPCTRWILLLCLRAILVAAFAYVLSRSISLSGLLLFTTLLQPLLGHRLPMRWLAESEGLWLAASMVFCLVLIRYFHLVRQWVPASIFPAQLAALCILAATLFIVVRGGTRIVRGVLAKSGSWPSKARPRAIKEQLPSSGQLPSEIEAAGSVISIAASSDQPSEATIDVEEYNRGRLIGNLERIVLTIVVAGGSYAALAFLVAAKGIARSDEFEKSRDFTEYFLIGSLSSVLVALCAGLAVRFAPLRLWPNLLTLQMQ